MLAVKKSSAALAGLLLAAVLAFGLGSAAVPAEPKVHVVAIDSMQFSPAEITVRPGDTVEFRNLDLVPHTVTERDTRWFDSGMIAKGGTLKLVCNEPGLISYRCIYHPSMMGTITVGTVTKAARRSDRVATEVCGLP